MTPPTARAIVIGAGVVGLATARQLAQGGMEVYILERGPRIAEGVTSRNSGVIHSPLNYPSGTLKSSLCMRGRELLYEYCEKRGVPHRRIGKLVMATNEDESERLEEILKRAHEAGATEVRLVSGVEASELEPECISRMALYSPQTGIVDPTELSGALMRDAEAAGAVLATNATVLSIEKAPAGFTVQSSIGEITAEIVVNAAGLHSDEIATLAGVDRYRITPWRGDYFHFRSGRRFSRLIYPVRGKNDPGLGVHLTLDLEGNARLGPDAELALSKEDFVVREDKAAAFLDAARKLFPWAKSSMLRYDTCGIRPKVRDAHGTIESDFIISQDIPGLINLVGIESPGLTASLAIAERVRGLL